MFSNLCDGYKNSQSIVSIPVNCLPQGLAFLPQPLPQVSSSPFQAYLFQQGRDVKGEPKISGRGHSRCTNSWAEPSGNNLDGSCSSSWVVRIYRGCEAPPQSSMPFPGSQNHQQHSRHVLSQCITMKIACFLQIMSTVCVMLKLSFSI